ncbi:sugar kinase [Deinococcus metallilatus]|nr:sugar kinase [Deinococcus metallilatus]
MPRVRATRGQADGLDLGLDLGTGSVKAALFEGSRLVRVASAPYAVTAPHPGWAESAPGAWWAATVQATREVLGDHGPEVRAVGLSGQMHGVVLSDGRGHPLRPAILWADARTTPQLAVYRALPAPIRTALRNPLTTGMAGPTLLWLREQEGDTYRAARWALQPKDWLRLHLTGEARAEPSDASGTLLYDLEGEDWNRALLDRLGLRPGLLAPLLPSRAVAGTLKREPAQQLGLSPGLPVAAGGADTAAALLGTGLPTGQGQLTVGTGAQLVLRQDTLPEAQPGLHVLRDTRDRGWYTLAAVQNAGVALEWARRVLRCGWEEFYALARQAPPGAGGLLFLPYLTGDRTPHLDPNARGGWIGAGLEHDAPHLARAAFEGVALSIAEAAALLPSAVQPAWRLAGGGSVQPWWRQLLADVLARPLELLDVPSASAFGAALLAGAAATGRPPDLPDWRSTEVVEPAGEGVPAGTRDRFSAAYQALRPWFAQRRSTPPAV